MDQQSMRMDCPEDVIRTFANMIYKLAFARTGIKYDADEVFQEVFLRYIKKKPQFRDEEHCKAWLIRVTINCCKKLQGSNWKKRTEPLNEAILFETKEDLGLYQELQKLPLSRE